MALKDFQMPHSLVKEENSQDEFYAKFTAQPFQRGFGHTIGNALRRVLLSSLEGAAISAVRIDGVSLEFTTIPNVIEDVTEIVLNLKKVRLSLNDEVQVPYVLEIRRNKAGAVTAGDIAHDPNVTVLNPEQVICTLDKDMPFRAEIELSRGRGWVPAEKNKKPTHPQGTIAIDSLFSPVKHVRYQVGAARVGDQTELDSLEIEIQTDGRVTAQDAIHKAAVILSEHLRPFLGDEVAEPQGAQILPPEKMELYKLLIQPVDVLDLSVRAMNCLNNANIKLLGELTTKSESRMLKFRNFGKKSLDEINEKLAARELSLGMTFDDDIVNMVQQEAERIKNIKKEEA